MSDKHTTDTAAERPDEDGEGPDESSLAWGTTAFEPGGDVALVARHTVGLIERDNPSTRERLWGLVAGDAPLDDILDELSTTGLKALPDFGLAQVEGSAVRIVARGRTKISAELGSGGTHEIDASGVRTWIEELVDDVAGITIALPSDDDASSTGEAFAVLAGSVPASSLTRRYDDADDHAALAETGAGWRAGGTDSPAPVADVEAELASTSGADGAAELDASDDVEASAESSRLDVGESEPEGVDDEPAPPIAPQPSHERDVAHAAPSAPQSDGPGRGVPPANPQPASPQPPPPGATPAGAVSTSSASGGSEPGGAPPRPRASGPEPTVVVGERGDSKRGPATSIFDDDFDDHAAGSVTEMMSLDDEGHGDGPAAGSDTDEQSTTTLTPGALVFSNGERIELERAVLIGRNPKVAAGAVGEPPRIMKFDGPGQGLSRTHAEVRIEPDGVVVEDLHSTNGTEVQFPGQPRRRLVGGEPIAIVPGTLIDFGDELHCTFEATTPEA